jgi:hypothetical protein
MRRTKMMLAAAAVTVSLSTAGAGVAVAQETPENPDLAEQCASYNFLEWLLFHHECHGHTGDGPYYPSMLSWLS